MNLSYLCWFEWVEGRYSILEEDEKYLSLRNIENKILTKEMENKILTKEMENKIQTEDKINMKVLILLNYEAYHWIK